MIYTTNWIERLNLEYKRVLSLRGAMPSAEAALFLLGQVALQKSQTTYSKKVPHIEAWTLKENRESAL